MEDLESHLNGLRHNGTYYDLLAMLCWMIRMRVPNSQQLYEEYTTHYSDLIAGRNRRFPELLAKGKTSPVLYKPLPLDTLTVVQALFRPEPPALCPDWHMVLAVIEALDNLIVPEENLGSFRQKRRIFDPCDTSRQAIDVSESVYDLFPLNPNTKEKYGELYPKTPCRWSRDNGRSMDTVSGDPLSCLHHYLWVRPNAGWTTEHLLLAPSQTDGGPIRVLLSPLTRNAPFQLETPDEGDHFYIHYDPTAALEVTDNTKRAIETAIRERVRLSVLPEIMASPDCVRECARFIQDMDGVELPQLFLLPTCEYQKEGQCYNELLVLDGDGYCVLEYHKQHPFRLDVSNEKHYFEPITSDNHLCVIHTWDMGRIGILICSDVFKPDYLEYILKEYRVTLLLHILFSSGQDLLLRRLALTNSYMCDTLLCNTCAAWNADGQPPNVRDLKKPPEGGIVAGYLPNGHRNTNPLVFSGCETPDKCRGCAVIAELPDQYKKPVPALQLQLYNK